MTRESFAIVRARQLIREVPLSSLSPERMMPWEMVVASTRRIIADQIAMTEKGAPHIRHSAARLEEAVHSVAPHSLPIAKILTEVSLNLWLSVGDRDRAIGTLAQYVSLTAHGAERVPYFEKMIRRGGAA